MDDLISKLSEIRSEYNCFNEDEEPYYRALSKAISVLSRHADDDTISRQEAINALRKALYEYEDKTEKQFQESEDLDIYDWIVHRIFVQNMNDIDVRAILDLPSVERHGQWIMHINDLFPAESTMECDQCHEEQPLECDDSYCPSCGAKMDKEEEE